MRSILALWRLQPCTRCRRGSGGVYRLSIHGPLFPSPPSLFPLGSRSALPPTLTSTYDADDAVCQYELNVCLLEPDCFACYMWTHEASLQKANSCMGKYFNLGPPDMCAVYSYTICCADEVVTTVDCAGNAAFVEAMLCQNSDYSTNRYGGEECTSFSCLPATTTSEQGDDDGVAVTTDDGSASTKPWNACQTRSARGVGERPWTRRYANPKPGRSAPMSMSRRRAHCLHHRSHSCSGGCLSGSPPCCLRY